MFELSSLQYNYDSLEPYISKRTMELHHDKHHQAYINKLNEALAQYPDLQNKSIEELMVSLDTLPEDIRVSVRNNGGGHYSHSVFWKIMNPNSSKEPVGDLAEAINAEFGGFGKFKEEFTKAANTLFGSGWVWLTFDMNKKLSILSTSGHDNPAMAGLPSILVIDAWEHAYYLDYQNRRPEYTEAWWSVVNWEEANNTFKKAKLL